MECARGWRSMLKLAAMCFALAVALCCVCSSACSGCGGRTRSEEGAAAVALRSDFRRRFRRRTSTSCANQGCRGEPRRPRRLLSEGPGSHPPRCTSKCGDCSPCYPVHVAVPPGVPVTTEYYPEAWRCKCGNRLYMP